MQARAHADWQKLAQRGGQRACELCDNTFTPLGILTFFLLLGEKKKKDKIFILTFFLLLLLLPPSLPPSFPPCAVAAFMPVL